MYMYMYHIDLSEFSEAEEKLLRVLESFPLAMMSESSAACVLWTIHVENCKTAASQTINLWQIAASLSALVPSPSCLATIPCPTMGREIWDTMEVVLAVAEAPV